MNFRTEQSLRPIHYVSYESEPSQSVRGTRHGEIALVLCSLAVLATPLLILLPIAGFTPALLALGGAVVAWLGLKRAPHRRALVTTGLITGTVVFALTMSLATIWHATVILPAINDYEDLGVAVDNARNALFA